MGIPRSYFSVASGIMNTKSSVQNNMDRYEEFRPRTIHLRAFKVVHGSTLML